MRNVITSALLVALVAISTMFIKIPLSVVGYVHLGDAFIFFACFLLKPKYSVVVGSVGSALADLLLGYLVYAPVTLVTKGILALTSALLIYKKPTFVRQIFAVIVGSIIIALGYFVFETFMYGVAIALANVLFNLIQGVSCGVVAIALIKAFDKVKFLKDFKEKL